MGGNCGHRAPQRTWRGSSVRRGDTYESSYGEEVLEGMVQEDTMCGETHICRMPIKKGYDETPFRTI